MDDDEKRAWLLEHCIFGLLNKDIDRMFQRLNYFFVGTAFLVAGFATLAAQQTSHTNLTGLMGTIVVAGLVLCVVFYGTASWNSWLAWRYHTWAFDKGDNGPIWLWNHGATVDIGGGCQELVEQHSKIYRWSLSGFLDAQIDLRLAAKAGLLARFVPALLFVGWLYLAIFMPTPRWPLWIPLAMVGCIMLLGAFCRRVRKLQQRRDRPVYVSWDLFAKSCLRRSGKERTQLDDFDRFVWAWMAFNSWMKRDSVKDEFECKLVKKAWNDTEMKLVYDEVVARDNVACEVAELRPHTVRDMRPEHQNQEPKSFDGTYRSFVGFAYQVRCNLFHGAKNVEVDEKDKTLVQLCYRILYAVFSEYLAKKGLR